MLDTVRLTETPEGIELSLCLAGPTVRALAWVIDFFIRFVIILILAIPLTFLGLVGKGILLMLWFFFEWMYPVLFEVKNHGATPGKKMMGLRVVHDDGSPIGWQASIIRNLLRAADFLPLFYAVGLVTMLFQSDYKRLGDLAANSLVIYRDNPQSHRLLEDKTAVTPGVALNLSEQRNIIEFSERSARLSQERQEELADILQSLTKTRGPHSVDKLFGMANWLMGGRS